MQQLIEKNCEKLGSQPGTSYSEMVLKARCTDYSIVLKLLENSGGINNRKYRDLNERQPFSMN